MRRRDFILFGGVSVAWPGALLAQPTDRVRQIGVLMASDVDAQRRPRVIAQGFQELGWTEGHNIRIDYRWAMGDANLLRTFAKELVEPKPDVILAVSSPATRALLSETQTIPIVFVHVADPVGQGFVKSLARPGGNVTGFSNYDASLSSKWLGLLKEIAPGVTRVALLYNPDTAPFADLFLRSLEAAAPSFGIEPIPAPVRNTADIDEVISAQARSPGGALIALTDVFVNTNRHRIVDLAARYRLPAMYPWAFFPTAGGLISYGIDEIEPFRQAPAYIDRILKGQKPGDLPIQGPTKLTLVVNLKTAAALGLTIPPTLLAHADEVIE